MRLSQYAKNVGVSYKTAYRWWKAGKLDAYQLPGGMVVVRDEVSAQPITEGVALYARVAALAAKPEAEKQLQRLREFAAAKGYRVVKEVIEIASGLSEQRPKLNNLLSDPKISLILVEQRERLTRFGFGYITQLLEMQGRRVEVVYQAETDDELVADLLEVIGNLAVQLAGAKNSRRRAEQIRECVARCLEEPAAEAGGEPTKLALPV